MTQAELIETHRQKLRELFDLAIESRDASQKLSTAINQAQQELDKLEIKLLQAR